MNLKKILSVAIISLFSATLLAQDDVATLRKTAQAFLMVGDYNNAILVLNKALQADNENNGTYKDLIQAYFLKKDYRSALEKVEKIVDREDADEATFQLAGNVYKALAEIKKAESMYKKALKKFPKSGPLYSEYGEFLWSKNDYSAIEKWEKGIQIDPTFSGNYYNAARYYYQTRDKVWSIIYGEIFINMEYIGERSAAMKAMLLNSYKEKLFSNPDLMVGEEKNENAFSKAFLITMNKQTDITSKGLSPETLTMIRTRFILDWFNTYSKKFPLQLFDYQLQLIKGGMFDAYNQWLFGPVDNLAVYENWLSTHDTTYAMFNKFQRNRIFKMPAGQYYQGK